MHRRLWRIWKGSQKAGCCGQTILHCCSLEPEQVVFFLQILCRLLYYTPATSSPEVKHIAAICYAGLVNFESVFASLCGSRLVITTEKPHDSPCSFFTVCPVCWASLDVTLSAVLDGGLESIGWACLLTPRTSCEHRSIPSHNSRGKNTHITAAPVTIWRGIKMFLIVNVHIYAHSDKNGVVSCPLLMEVSTTNWCKITWKQISWLETSQAQYTDNRCA